MPGRTARAHWDSDSDRAHIHTVHRKRRDGASAAHGACAFRSVYHAYADQEHPRGGRPGGSAFQFEREAIGADTVIAGAIRQRRPAARGDPEGVARNASGDDRGDTVAGQFFHEQIQETGIHQVQRGTAGEHFVVERGTARLEESRAYSLQSTAYSPQPTVHSLESTAYSLQSTAYSPQPTVYSLQSTAYSLQPTVHSLQSTAYSLQFAVHSLRREKDTRTKRRSCGVKWRPKRKRGRDPSTTRP